MIWRWNVGTLGIQNWDILIPEPFDYWKNWLSVIKLLDSSMSQVWYLVSKYRHFGFKIIAFRHQNTCHLLSKYLHISFWNICILPSKYLNFSLWTTVFCHQNICILTLGNSLAAKCLLQSSILAGRLNLNTHVFTPPVS
jgi:hypothetical protein